MKLPYHPQYELGFWDKQHHVTRRYRAISRIFGDYLDLQAKYGRFRVAVGPRVHADISVDTRLLLLPGACGAVPGEAKCQGTGVWYGMVFLSQNPSTENGQIPGCSFILSVVSLELAASLA